MSTSRKLKPSAILLPSCIGAILGPLWAIALFVIAFLIGAAIFHQAFLAFAGVYLFSLLFGLLGWIAGAYLPTILSFFLSSDNRLTHWAISFIALTIYGAVLYSVLRWGFRIIGPRIADYLLQVLPPMLP